jgi:1-acyl-sn-glycerol-3-phosphate acyltransferase
LAVRPVAGEEPHGATAGWQAPGADHYPRLYRAVRGLTRLLTRLYWRIEVEGTANVPQAGPVILAPVHRSNVDFLVATQVTRRKVFYMAKDTLWRYRRFGQFLEWGGAFPVHREGTDRLAVTRSQTVLEHAGVLIVFPEGTRRAGPVVETLHEGAAFLAARTGAPIVPIGIGGSAEVMPKGSKMVRPVKVHVVVGDPIAPPARSDGGRVPRHQVHQVTEQLRDELQRVYDAALARTAAGDRR